MTLRLRSGRALLLAAVLASGCATTGKAEFLSAKALEFDASKYPDDAALVLYRKDHTELIENGSEDYTDSVRHEVIAVLGEGGFDLAEVRIPLWSKSKLLHFNARVVQPDGTQQTFDGAQMLTDTGGKGDHDAGAKFFRFPDVRVGSVLEYSWRVESPGLWSADDQDTLGVFPVKKYEFELTAPRTLVLETIEFNGGSPIQVRNLNDGGHQLHFELENLPPRRDADFAPHWTFTEPRWAWRAVAYKSRGFKTDWLRDWKDVVEGRGRVFFVEGKLEKDLTVPLDVSGCADVKCKVERAMALLVKRTTTRGVKWNREEKLASALESGKASVVERALLLKFLLAREGLDVWLGYGTGRLSQQTSPTFPRLAQFDHLFVHLPVQPGVDQAVTLDPSCDYCGFGQLPTRYLGTPVYVFKTKPELSQVDTTGRWITAAEDEPPPSRFVVTHQARLHADGTVSDQLAVRTTGTSALEHLERQRTWTAKKLKETEQNALSHVSPLAIVAKVNWSQCDAAGCGWDTEVSFPLEASSDGRRWLVPTTVLARVWEGFFESPQREVDVHFNDSELIEEIFELAVDDGLELTSVPPPLSLELEGLSAEVSFEKTPRGVRVKRKLAHDVGAVSKHDYAALREAVEGFRRGRREVLVFAPKK